MSDVTASRGPRWTSTRVLEAVRRVECFRPDRDEHETSAWNPPDQLLHKAELGRVNEVVGRVDREHRNADPFEKRSRSES